MKARDFWEAGCWLEFGENLDRATVRGGLHSYADQFRRFPLPAVRQTAGAAHCP